jgi:solute carrier family 35, member F1/2
MVVKPWILLFAGQFLSLLITGTGVFSQLLAIRNVNIPTAQSFCNYLLLCLFWIPWCRSEQRIAGIQGRSYLSPKCYFSLVAWWKYFFIALCDVEGNFLIVKVSWLLKLH